MLETSPGVELSRQQRRASVTLLCVPGVRRSTVSESRKRRLKETYGENQRNQEVR